MTYVICTDRSKKCGTPDGYWSRAFGCFSRRDQATHFPNFDAAQPKVRELRSAGVLAYAVEVAP